MILDKTVKIKAVGCMIKIYKELGYNVKQYDVIDLPIEKLTRYSHMKVLCSCDICGDEKYVAYNNYCKYVENSSKHIYTCNICNLDERKKTCLEKYGFDNVFNNFNYFNIK